MGSLNSCASPWLACLGWGALTAEPLGAGWEREAGAEPWNPHLHFVLPPCSVGALPSTWPGLSSLPWAEPRMDPLGGLPASYIAFQPVLHSSVQGRLVPPVSESLWWVLPGNRTGTWDAPVSALPNQLPLTHLLSNFQNYVAVSSPILCPCGFTDKKILYCCNGVLERSECKCMCSGCGWESAHAPLPR